MDTKVQEILETAKKHLKTVKDHPTTQQIINHPITQRIWQNILKYKWYIGSVIVIVVIKLVFFGSTSTATPITVQDIYTVRSGNITNSIKVLGNTKITDQQTLTFGQE
jgi:hypothetical protein